MNDSTQACTALPMSSCLHALQLQRTCCSLACGSSLGARHDVKLQGVTTERDMGCSLQPSL